MDVDVTTEITIDRPRAEVAEYTCDPDHATEWYANITDVKWKSPKPLAVGSLVEFTAKFLGRRLVYTYEIAELVPGTRFVMRTADGPFPMVTTYEFSDVGRGGNAHDPPQCRHPRRLRQDRRPRHGTGDAFGE